MIELATPYPPNVSNPEKTIHVFGPALIQIDVGGTVTVSGTAVVGATWQNLGFTEIGVDITEIPNVEDVMTDFGGTHMATDGQFMGLIANIRSPMVTWNNAILQYVLAGIANTGVEGFVLAKDVGTLMLAASRKFSIRVIGDQRSGLPLEPAYAFPAAWFTSEIPQTMGTRFTRSPITAKAIPLNGVLYERQAVGQ